MQLFYTDSRKDQGDKKKNIVQQGDFISLQKKLLNFSTACSKYFGESLINFSKILSSFVEC